MIQQLRTLVFVGAAAASTAALAQTPTPGVFDETFELTMNSARATAADQRQIALADVAPVEVAGYDAQLRLAQLDAGAALSALQTGVNVAAVEASPAASARLPANDAVLAQRKAMGIAHERAARRSNLVLTSDAPPLVDEKGYYFTYTQTWDYLHNATTDRNGVFPASYYRDLRCRAAPRIGPFAVEPHWRTWNLRVCPDEQGRYRPAI